MSEFMKTLLSLSLSGTLIFLLLKLLKPLYRERFSRRWQYYVWLVVALRFLIPLSPETALMNRVFTGTEAVVQEYAVREQTPGTPDAGREEVGQAAAQDMPETAPGGGSAPGQEAGETAEAGSAEGMAGGTAGTENAQPFWGFLFLIWSFTALLFLLFRIRAYRRFARSLTSENGLVLEGRPLELLDACERELRLKRKVRLYRGGKIASPVLLGFWRPALILPEKDIPEETLLYVFRHELTHCRRRDGLYKWLIQLVICAHWFNPFVYRLEKEISQACELACDEAVIAPLDREERRKYGSLLLAFAGAGDCFRGYYISAGLSEGGEHLKERLGAIMKFRKETKWAVAASAAALLALIAGAVWIGSYIGPAGGRGAEGTGQQEIAVEDVLFRPGEGPQAGTDLGNGAGTAFPEGTETVPAEGVQKSARLELAGRKDACPYVELSFQLIEESGETRIFPSDPADIPLYAEFEPGEPTRWDYSVTAAEKENDTVSLSFWSSESGSVTVTIDGLSCTAEFQKEEPEEIMLNQEIAVYGGTAMMGSVLLYPDAVTVNLSGLSSEAYQNTALILAEEGTVYGDGNNLDGYRGTHSYSAEDETYTGTYAFPDGLPEDRDLVFRVINLRERDEQGDRLYGDYPLGAV